MPSPEILLVPGKYPPVSSVSFEHVYVLGVRVGVLTRHRLTALLRESFDSGQKGWFSYINVHAINLSQDAPWFRLFLNDSLVTYCDGQGVRLGAALAGKTIPERIVMSDWIYDICELAVLRQAKVFLLGSTAPILEQAVAALKRQYPGLRIVGSHHGYISDLDGEVLLQTINKANPELLIVGMGMPIQEQWILKYSTRIQARLIFNAGSCLDYVAGAKKRCPDWMGIMGLEWLYRLAKEPRRLWRRYLFGNPLFLYHIIRERLKQRKES
jgi:N-acetylglucosaminyldiphosphoundecaprenol N-acetyl-beta-D-mannosaminyltransferase